MNDARYNVRRQQRGADAVEIFGLWMSVKDLNANIKDFGDDDAELKRLCEIGLECYRTRQDHFTEVK